MFLQICLVASSCININGVDDDEVFIHTIWQWLGNKYKACPIVFIPEVNLGKEASHLEKYVRNHALTVTMRESTNVRMYGVRKTDFTTLEMHRKMLTMMAKHNLFVNPDCIGIPTDVECKKHGLIPGTPAAGKYMLEKVREQLNNYSWVPTTVRTNTLEQHCKLSGKKGKKNDDLCICAMMVPYWSDIFWETNDDSYLRARKNMGMVRQ